MNRFAWCVTAVLVGTLTPVDAGACRACGGINDYRDWECLYTPRSGWSWQLVLVGRMFCDCGCGPCSLSGRSTTCVNSAMTETCGGGDSCDGNYFETCSLPLPSSACSGPMPAADREGWVWHSGAAGTYTPASAWSYNSTGGINQISNPSVGRYTVTLPGLGGFDGSAQVVAYGSSNHRCKVGGWTGLPNLTIDVRCHTPAGAPVNTPFAAHFFATDDTGTTTAQVGHAYYDPFEWWSQPFAYQWNSAGALPATSQLDVGYYKVRFPNQLHQEASVVVTAVGANANFCQSMGWSVDATGTDLLVTCFDSVGALADSAFSLRYEWRQPSWASDQKLHGYLLASQATIPSYTPSWQFNTTGVANTASRSAVGRYQVTYPNLPPHSSTTVLISAWALWPSYCKPLNWGSNTPTGASTFVNARCFTHAGVASDVGYTQVYLTTYPYFIEIIDPG